VEVKINESSKKDPEFKRGDVVEYRGGIYLITHIHRDVFECAVIHKGGNVTPAGGVTNFERAEGTLRKVSKLTVEL
jgi:hypothetical protein